MKLPLRMGSPERAVVGYQPGVNRGWKRRGNEGINEGCWTCSHSVAQRKSTKTLVQLYLDSRDQLEIELKGVRSTSQIISKLRRCSAGIFPIINRVMIKISATVPSSMMTMDLNDEASAKAGRDQFINPYQGEYLYTSSSSIILLFFLHNIGRLHTSLSSSPPNFPSVPFSSELQLSESDGQ